MEEQKGTESGQGPSSFMKLTATPATHATTQCAGPGKESGAASRLMQKRLLFTLKALALNNL